MRIVDSEELAAVLLSGGAVFGAVSAALLTWSLAKEMR